MGTQDCPISLEGPGQSWRRQPCFRRTHRTPQGMRRTVLSGCHRSREPWHGASKSLGSQAGRERMVAQEVSCPLHTRDMRAEAGFCALERDVWAILPAPRSIPKPCPQLSQESGGTGSLGLWASSQVSSWQSHWPPSFKSVRFILQMKGSCLPLALLPRLLLLVRPAPRQAHHRFYSGINTGYTRWGSGTSLTKFRVHEGSAQNSSWAPFPQG